MNLTGITFCPLGANWLITRLNNFVIKADSQVCFRASNKLCYNCESVYIEGCYILCCSWIPDVKVSSCDTSFLIEYICLTVVKFTSAKRNTVCEWSDPICYTTHKYLIWKLLAFLTINYRCSFMTHFVFPSPTVQPLDFHWIAWVVSLIRIMSSPISQNFWEIIQI